MVKGNRIKKVNMVVNLEIWFLFVDKCKEQGVSVSGSFEIWMKFIFDSESVMKSFDNIFSVLVDAEVKKRLKE